MLKAFVHGFNKLQPGSVGQLASAVRTASSAALQRGSQFAQLTHDDLTFFKEVLGEKGVITDPDALQPYNRCVCM
jgi:hypothetical protein